MENIHKKLLGIGLSILAVGFIGTAIAFTAAYETTGEADADSRTEICRKTCPADRDMYMSNEDGRGVADSLPDATAAGNTPETAYAVPGGDMEAGNPQLKQTNR